MHFGRPLWLDSASWVPIDREGLALPAWLAEKAETTRASLESNSPPKPTPNRHTDTFVIEQNKRLREGRQQGTGTMQASAAMDEQLFQQVASNQILQLAKQVRAVPLVD